MDNEVQSNIPPVQTLPQTPPLISRSSSWLKILLFTFLGLFIVAGSVFIGIQIGKNQIPKQQPIAIQPTSPFTQITVTPTILLTTPEPATISATLPAIPAPTDISTTFPRSYQECVMRITKSRNLKPADNISPFCEYSVEITNPLYQECLSYDGIKTPSVCAGCPGCGCIPAGCKFTFIDPNLILPTNYNECTKISPHSGGRDGGNGGKEYCSILLPKQVVIDKDNTQQLLKACFSQNGEKFVENSSCKLKFYQE